MTFTLPDVGLLHDRSAPDDFDARNGEGHVLWGPQRASNPLRTLLASTGDVRTRLLAASLAPGVHAADKVERRRRSRRVARGIRGLAAAIRGKAA